MTHRDTLELIKARAEAASPGPWSWREHAWHVTDLLDPHGNSLIDGDDSSSGAGPGKPEDADFIAHARDDLPRLVACLEAILDLTEDWANPDFPQAVKPANCAYKIRAVAEQHLGT